MIFSLKKKTLRDREAGMVFRWRGSLAGNTGGLTLAILMTTGLFAVAFVGLSIRVEKKVPGTRRTAEVTLVTEDDPRLEQWLDDSSPFPARWDPADSAEVTERVDEVLTVALREAGEREFSWRELPDVAEVVETPAIYGKGELIFPDLPDSIRAVGDGEMVQYEVKAEVAGSGGDRFPKELELFAAEIPMGEFGKQYRWFVTLGGDGEVIYCVPVEPLDDVFAEKLERWLRVQPFRAGADGETLEVIVEVVRGEGEDD